MSRVNGSSWEERARQVDRFLWHFAELAVVLMVGMFALNIANMLNLFPVGYNYVSRTDAVSYSSRMVGTILVMMILWMRYRHYSPRYLLEISLSISLPVLLLDLLSFDGLLPESSLLVGTNIVVWIGMLSAMLYRWNLYSQPLQRVYAKPPSVPSISRDPSSLSNSGIAVLTSFQRSEDDLV